MKTEMLDVRSGGQVVGKAECVECGNIEEAITHFGEAKVLQFINTASKTAALNEARRVATEGSKVHLKSLRSLTDCVTDPQDIEQLAKAIAEGDMDTFAAIVKRAQAVAGLGVGQ